MLNKKLLNDILNVKHTIIDDVKMFDDDSIVFYVHPSKGQQCWDIESYIQECVEKYQIPANKMWIKMTEQDMLSNTDNAIKKLFFGLRNVMKNCKKL